MSKIYRFLIKLPPYLLSIIIFLVINYLTLVKNPLGGWGSGWFTGADKIVHAVMFAALAGALYLDIVRRKNVYVEGAKVALICAVLATIVGGEIEIMQGAGSAGRSAEWLDFAADAVGALVGAFVAIPLWRYLSVKALRDNKKVLK